MNSWSKQCHHKSGATIFSYPVKDPQRFGVIEFENFDDGPVVSIEEKPENPKSNRALIGIYFFDSKCVQYSKQLKPSSRGELEIIDLIKMYLESNTLDVYNLTRTMTWIDAGTFESLLLASNFISNHEKIQSYKISCPEEISYKQRWISGKELLKLSDQYPKSGYGDYLKSIIEDY